MSESELQITYAPDDEWLGEVTAVVRSGAYSGKGTAWFDRQTLKEKFVARLRCFPLSSQDPPTFEGGFGASKGQIAQCHLRLSIKPYNTRGTLLVCVELATPSWKSPDVDLQNSATIRFLTEYEAVSNFAKEVGDVLDGVKEEASLKGTAT